MVWGDTVLELEDVCMDFSHVLRSTTVVNVYRQTVDDVYNAAWIILMLIKRM